MGGGGVWRGKHDRGRQRHTEGEARPWTAATHGGVRPTVGGNGVWRGKPDRGRQQSAEEGAWPWAAATRRGGCPAVGGSGDSKRAAAAGAFDRDLKSHVWRESGVEHGLCKLFKHRQK
jgi:hypothetical protein